MTLHHISGSLRWDICGGGDMREWYLNYLLLWKPIEPSDILFSFVDDWIDELEVQCFHELRPGKKNKWTMLNDGNLTNSQRKAIRISKLY